MTICTFQAAKTLCEFSKWRLSNLPLQKLLYLSHMYHMGTNNEGLIDGHFEAWDLGPVEPTLYRKVKAYGGSPIVDIFPCDVVTSGREFDSMFRVYDDLKSVMPSQLVDITHWEGGAWAKNYQPKIYGISIPDQDILDEFRERTK